MKLGRQLTQFILQEHQYLWNLESVQFNSVKVITIQDCVP